MNWNERYRKEKEAGAISDFIVQHAIPFYQQHVVPVEKAIWPDPGAIEHDARFMINRKIPGTPEYVMGQGAEHLLRQIKGVPQTVIKKVKGPRESNLEEAGSEPQ